MLQPIALSPEAAAALDAPHLVHAVDATGAYLGLIDRRRPTRSSPTRDQK